MNVHESDKLRGILEKQKYIETKDVNKADIIIFNTCCIRKSAEDKIIGNIGALKPLKKINPNLIVAVCGCMTQQVAMSKYIKETFKFVDIIFGTHNIHKFEEFLIETEKNKTKIFEIIDDDNAIHEDVPISRTTKFNAYVNIMYGCNNFCTYCIVPLVRGREKSREKKDIINEVEELLKSKKYKSITLLGQNVNSYGKDLSETITFASLLDEIANLPYDFVLKFLTSHPKDLSQELIDTIAKNSKISKAIHLPIQSGCNKILKLMNRNYTKEHYLDIIKRIREKIPNVAISSDIIVGFPNETDEDFKETCDLVREVGFNSLYVFMYSKRENTPASLMENQVPIKIKKSRINELIQIEKEVASIAFKKMINSEQKVIVEEEIIKESRFVMTRTDCGKTVLIESNNAKVGEFLFIKITDIIKNQLIGIEIK